MTRQKYNKKLLRLAETLASEMQRHERRVSLPQLPEHQWRLCQKLVRQLSFAQQKQFNRAAAELAPQLQSAVVSLARQLNAVVNSWPANEPRAPIAPAGQIYRDLVALEQEFDELDGSVKNGTISATTAPIMLEGVELGRFRIDLHFRPWGTDPTHYMIEALDPNPARTDSSVTHPHIQDGVLCAGDGRRALERAMEEGRIADFFLVIRSVLETYNSGGAYVALKRWNGIECHDCGGTIDPDDAECCHHCDYALCEDCRLWCDGCDEPYCSRCTESCSSCQEDTCTNCLSRCRDCRSRTCENCQTEGRCHECHERQEQAAAGSEVRQST